MFPRSTAALVVLLATGALSGCSTVHQAPVGAESTGFTTQPRPVPGGYLVDATFRDRYNSLVEIYGRKKLADGAPVFVPPLRKDAGLTGMGDGTWYMTLAAMEDMAVLSDLKRRGAAP